MSSDLIVPMDGTGHLDVPKAGANGIVSAVPGFDVERLLTEAGFERQVSMTEPYVNAAAVRHVLDAAVAAVTATERAAFEKLLSLPMADLLLMAGEMTAGERRTVRAVLNGLTSLLTAASEQGSCIERTPHR